MWVRDVMTRPVVTTRPEISVKDAAVVLAGHRFTALPVVDQDGRLVGMLSEADVVRGRISPDPRHRAWQGTEAGSTASATVGEVMSCSPVSVDPQADAADLAATMIDRGLRSVPVVEEDRVVGIVTRRNLVRIIARDDSLIAADIRRRLARYGGLDRWAVQVHQGSVTITDDYADQADHHVALVLAQAVPGVVHVEVTEKTPAAGAGDRS
ncbi:MAG: CBS domain-containing protein [Pseudonocardiaceae bacterium]